MDLQSQNPAVRQFQQQNSSFAPQQGISNQLSATDVNAQYQQLLQHPQIQQNIQQFAAIQQAQSPVKQYQSNSPYLNGLPINYQPIISPVSAGNATTNNNQYTLAANINPDEFNAALQGEVGGNMPNPANYYVQQDNNYIPYTQWRNNYDASGGQGGGVPNLYTMSSSQSTSNAQPAQNSIPFAGGTINAPSSFTPTTTIGH